MPRHLYAIATLSMAIVVGASVPALRQAPLPPAAALTLQLSNIRQAQFAGYYVARAKGYYAAANLTVTILPGAPDGDSQPPRLAPNTDLWSAWLPQALAARATGLPLVNIAQIFPHSGLELVCRKSSNIHSPEDFRGKTIAVWQDGAQIPFNAWMHRLNFAIPRDVTMLPIPRTSTAAAIAPFLTRAAACITALNYDQYWSILASGIAPADLQVFHYGDVGLATLQDGLYVTAPTLADPTRVSAVSRFLAASIQGWQYAVTHQPEAVAITTPDATGAEQTRQTRMLSAVARLTESGLQRMGYLEPAAYDRTTQLLTEAGQSPPLNAWTHAIWKHAVVPK